MPVRAVSIGRRIVALTIALLVAVLSSRIVSAHASAPATPYPTSSSSLGAGLTLALADQTPTAGGPLMVSGTGATPGETVSFTLHSRDYALGGASADRSGHFSMALTLPVGVTGAHEVLATGQTSGLSASMEIDIVSAVTTSSGSGGGLSSTGVAVVGLGAVGLVLIIGGGLVLLAGRRRRVHA